MGYMSINNLKNFDKNLSQNKQLVDYTNEMIKILENIK